MDRNKEDQNLNKDLRDKCVEILQSLEDPHNILDALKCLKIDIALTKSLCLNFEKVIKTLDEE